MATDQEHAPGQGSLPETLVKQVKDVLEQLYDLPYLQSHPLAQEVGLGAGASGEMAGQRLRRELIAAVETLSPGPDVPFRAPHARLYNLLHLRYVECMTVQEAAHELGISLRQAYRDLRHGEESVAAVLWARRVILPPQEPRAMQLSSVQAEMARLGAHPQPTDMRPLLQRAQEAVERLATQRDVHFHVEVPQEPVTVLTDPVMAQQVLISALSHALQQVRPGPLFLTLTVGEKQAFLTLRYDAEPGSAGAPVVNRVVAQLVDRLRWTVEQEERPEGAWVVAFRLPTRGPCVLVIDDNEGLVDLLDRYLTDQGCRVIPAASGQEGLGLAQELLPDAVVLDVMMPGMDGWELLQRLRAHPRTADIPVVICSVFNDPELAYSLGASLSLPKPVSRDDVLTALRQLGVV